MATNVLMPISPPESSKPLGASPTGRTLSEKYLRNSSLRASHGSASKGSLNIKKSVGLRKSHAHPVKETGEKKSDTVVRSIDFLR